LNFYHGNLISNRELRIYPERVRYRVVPRVQSENLTNKPQSWKRCKL